jgi:hypothetical protein
MPMNEPNMSGSNETGSCEQCINNVRLMARRTALLYDYLVTVLAEHMGQERAVALAAEAIGRYGEHIGRSVRQGVEAMGSSRDVENYGKSAMLWIK